METKQGHPVCGVEGGRRGGESGESAAAHLRRDRAARDRDDVAHARVGGREAAGALADQRRRAETRRLDLNGVRRALDRSERAGFLDEARRHKRREFLARGIKPRDGKQLHRAALHLRVLKIDLFNL